MYQLSHHAQQRIRERRLKTEWLVAALEGKSITQPDGTVMLCDPVSRCALVVEPKSKLIITALRLKKRKFKRLFSRRRTLRWPLRGEKLHTLH